MQFRPFEPDIEVQGRAISSMLEGFGAFGRLGGQYLLQEGVGLPGPDGQVRLQPEHWYSQAAWLRAFERIEAELGEAVLHQVGLKVPEYAPWPTWVVDLDSGLRSLDLVYHLRHRKAGRLLFDPATGQLTEGIGHYGYERVPGRNLILSVCHTPYPCAFDHGVLTAVARRFVAGARVDHAPGHPCRKEGAATCTYRIAW